MHFSFHDIGTNDKRIAINTIWLACRMVLIMIVNLIAVRFIRCSAGLGEVGYGVFNAVNGVVNLVLCLNTVLASASQRFFSVDLGRHEKEALQNDFRASVRVSFILLGIALPLLESIGLWIVYRMNYPSEMLREVMICYQTSIVMFGSMLLQVPFLACVLAHEKMNIFAIVSLSEAILRLLLALSLPHCATDHLSIYSIGLMFFSLLSTSIYIGYCKRHFEESRRGPVTDTTIYRRILTFSGWTMFGSLAGAVMIQGNTLLLNTYIGPVSNAAFAIGLQIYFAFVALGNNIIVAIRPQMVMSYSRQEYKEVCRLFRLSTIGIFVLVSIVAVPLIIYMPQVLTLWLGETTTLTTSFARMLILLALIMMLGTPITAILEAAGRVKEYHIPVESAILLSVLASWIWLAHGGPAIAVAYTLIGGALSAHILRIIVMIRYAYK